MEGRGPYLLADGFGFFVKTLFSGPGMASVRPIDSGVAAAPLLAVRTELTAPTTATTTPPTAHTNRHDIVSYQY